MKSRLGVGIVLAVLVTGSLVYAFGRRGEAAFQPMLVPAGGELGSEMTVYFFDTDVRCDTCLRIEAYAYEVVTTQYAEDYNAGRIGWMKLDLDAPENAHFAEDFGLYTKSVVLVEHDAAGVPVRWKNLDKVWDLVGDHTAYADYVATSIQAFRKEAM